MSTSSLTREEREQLSAFQQELGAALSQLVPGRYWRSWDSDDYKTGRRAILEANKKVSAYRRSPVLATAISRAIGELSRWFNGKCERCLERERKRLEGERAAKRERTQRWLARSPQEKRLHYLNRSRHYSEITHSERLDPVHFVRSSVNREVDSLHPEDRALLDTDPRKLERWLADLTEAFSTLLTRRLEEYAADNDSKRAWKLVADAHSVILKVKPDYLRTQLHEETQRVTADSGPKSKQWEVRAGGKEWRGAGNY